MKKTVLTLLLFPALLAGCNSTSSVKNTNTTPTNAMTIKKQDLEHHHWVLKTINGQPLVFLQDESAVTLEIGEGFSANGQGACNRYFGQAELNGNQFRIDKMASTMMACPDGEMQKEALITSVLSNWSTITLTKTNLTLSNAENTLVFQLRDWVN